MLLFWVPDTNVPFGGNKQAYRHIQILRDAGIDARALHSDTGFRYTWFENDVPVVYLNRRSALRRSRRALATLRRRPWLDLDIHRGRRIHVPQEGGYREHRLQGDDVIVLPEYPGRYLLNAVRDLSFAIFNQNPHGTFRGYGFERETGSTAYDQPNLLGVVVVSEHSKRYVSFAFPEVDIHRVINGVDARVFYPHEERPEQTLAFMPRKLPDHVEQVINLIRCRGALRNWNLAPIDKMSEQEVAARLRSSTVFMSTCKQEGFGLPPLEAAISGCSIVGYTGQAAAEYFDPHYSVPVPQDDVVALAEAVMDTMRRHEEAPHAMRRHALEFAGELRERYSLDNERKSVTEAWSAVLERAAAVRQKRS